MGNGINMSNLKTDIIIVGAGIIGCCIARELSKYNSHITIVEKEADCSAGTTKSNSGIIHPGYAGEIGSLKLKLSHRGNLSFKKNAQELNIPIKQIGSFLLAKSVQQEKQLNTIRNTGIKNGLTELDIIIGNENLREKEENLNKNICAALYSKETFITSPYEANIAVFENAKTNGVKFLFNSEVVSINYNKSERIFYLKTKDIFGNEAFVEASCIINAAGIFADNLAKMINDYSFNLNPVKGEYVLFDSTVSNYVKMVNYPFPEEKTKGVLISPTVDKNFFIGPNYKYLSSKSNKSTTYEGEKEIKNKIEEIFSNLPYEKIITRFAGIRAVSDTNDFILGPSYRYKRFINAAGIQSPGLTCAFTIAEIIVEHTKETGLSLKKNPKFIPERKSRARLDKIDYYSNNKLYRKNKNYGEIICRCEKVSEAEIIDAIKNGATTVDGVKFRTRAGMGRCQGGYCLLRIMEILSRELGIPYEEVTKSGNNSNIVKSKML